MIFLDSRTGRHWKVGNPLHGNEYQRLKTKIFKGYDQSMITWSGLPTGLRRDALIECVTSAPRTIERYCFHGLATHMVLLPTIVTLAKYCWGLSQQTVIGECFIGIKDKRTTKPFNANQFV